MAAQQKQKQVGIRLKRCVDDVKLAELVRARECLSRGRRFDSGKNSKTENSNLHGFELHRPSSKGTKLLFQVMKAKIKTNTVHNLSILFKISGVLSMLGVKTWQ